MKRTNKRPASRKRVLLVAALVGSAIAYGVYTGYSSPEHVTQHPRGHGQHSEPLAGEIPHYVADVDGAKPLPVTLNPALFKEAEVTRAYEIAREIPQILAQQPCYCWCDRAMGHRSLLDCYIDDHAAKCTVCMKEALLAKSLSQRGMNATDIRNAIIRGDWRSAQEP